LISDKVNIWREVESEGAGLVNSDTLEGTTRGLSDYIELPESSRRLLRDRALETFRRRFTADAMATSLLAVLAPRLADV
jgi:hypothetical protein